MEGEGMVAVVRGLRDAGLAVTLLDGSRQYTLMPNSITHTNTAPNQRAAVTNTNAATQPAPPKYTADSSTEPSNPQIDSGAQAVDGRYASMYKTMHCNMRPTSPPVQLTEFPPQRPELYPGHGNFQVGGTGSGATYCPIRPTSPVNFRGGLSWPDRGSVCSPRPSYEVDAFANSLRKYPNLSPDRSSEVMERLISYTQAKGLSSKSCNRNQTSPTRLSEPGSHHTLDPKATVRINRGYEPEITIRSKRVDETPTRDRKKDEYYDRTRNYDVRCIRDMSKRLRDNVKAMSSYPYNHPVCPTIKENHDHHTFPTEQNKSSNSVNMEIQAAVKMISKEVGSAHRDSTSRKPAAPESPGSFACEENNEGDCYVQNLDTKTSFKSIQTTFCPSDETLRPKKSVHTVCSSVDFKAKQLNRFVGRRSKSQEQIKATKDELRRSLLALIEEVSSSSKSKKLIRDELIRKLFDTDRNDRYNHKTDRKNKRQKIDKYVSTYCPSGFDYVEDFKELVGKLKQSYGDTKQGMRTALKTFRISEYKKLDDVLKDWINDLNIKIDDTEKLAMLSTVEDKIKDLFKSRTKQDFDLKSGIVKIIEELPIEIRPSYNKMSYLHRLVEVLLKRLQNVVISQQNAKLRRKGPVNRSKKILTEDDIRDFVREHLMDFFNECHIEICDYEMDELENELIDILIDSIDCIRCGHIDDASAEMGIILEDLAQLTNKQADYISHLILQNLQELLNNCNFNQTYTILHSNVNSGQQSANTTDTDFSISSLTQGDFNANLLRYTNHLNKKINEWLDSLNIPEIQDKAFREVVVNDLAGDIIDRHRYIELNQSAQGSQEDELEVLKYQIFKWINKLVGEENTETIRCAPELMQKIKDVPVPMLTNPQGRRNYSPGQQKQPIDPMRPCLGETGKTCTSKIKTKPQNTQGDSGTGQVRSDQDPSGFGQVMSDQVSSGSHQVRSNRDSLGSGQVKSDQVPSGPKLVRSDQDSSGSGEVQSDEVPSGSSQVRSRTDPSGSYENASHKQESRRSRSESQARQDKSRTYSNVGQGGQAPQRYSPSDLSSPGTPAQYSEPGRSSLGPGPYGQGNQVSQEYYDQDSQAPQEYYGQDGQVPQEYYGLDNQAAQEPYGQFAPDSNFQTSPQVSHGRTSQVPQVSSDRTSQVPQGYHGRTSQALQGSPGQASPVPQGSYGRTSQVPQVSHGRTSQVPQGSPGQTSPVLQESYGRTSQVPQVSHGRTSQVPQVSSDRTSQVPQGYHGRTSQALQGSPGQASPVPQGSYGRTSQVPQVSHGRTSQVPQGSPGQTSPVLQESYGRTSQVPQVSHGRTSQVPQVSSGRTSQVPQGSHGRTSQVLQGSPGQASPVPQGSYGRTSQVPQVSHGRTSQVPQGSPGQASPVLQESYGRISQVPQVSHGRTSQVPQVSSGRTSQVPQGSHGRTSQVLQGSPGQASPVPQGSYGRTSQLPQVSHGRTSQVPQGSPGQASPVPQESYGRTSQVPQVSHGQTNQVPQGSPGQASPVLHESYGRTSQVPQVSHGRTSQVPQVSHGRTSQVPQGSPGQASPFPQESYGQTSQVPQGSHGRTSQVPQETPGQASPVPQRSYGRTSQVPQVSQGRTSQVPQESPGQASPVPQGSYGRTSQVPQVSQGRTSQVPQVSHGRTSQVPQGSPGQASPVLQGPHGRTSQVPQEFPGQSSPVSQRSSARTSQVPQGSSGRTSQVPQGSSGRASPVYQESHGQTSQVPQASHGRTSQVPQGSSGRTSQVPQGSSGRASPVYQESHGQTSQVPHGSPGQASPVRQGSPGRTSQVPQGSLGRASPVSQESHGRTSQVPQASHGRTSQVPQGSPGRTSQVPQGFSGRASPVSQESHGRTSQVPQASHGRTSQVPQGSPGRTSQVPQRSSGRASPVSHESHSRTSQVPQVSHVRTSQVPHGSPGQASPVRQGSPGRTSQVPQGSLGRASPISQGSHGRTSHAPQVSHGRTSQVPQGSHVRTSQVPQVSYGQASPVSYGSYGLDSQFPQASYRQASQDPQGTYGPGSQAPQESYGQFPQGSYGKEFINVQGSPGGKTAGIVSFCPPATMSSPGPSQGPYQNWNRQPTFLPGSIQSSATRNPAGNFTLIPIAEVASPTPQRMSSPAGVLQLSIYGPSEHPIFGAGPVEVMLSPQDSQNATFTRSMISSEPCKVSLGATGTSAGKIGACCMSHDGSPPIPSSLKQINARYDEYLKQWVKKIPIPTTSPAEQQAAEKARLAVYNCVWKAITKLKLDPEVFSNPYAYQDAFHVELDALFASLPKSDDLDTNKHKLKIELLEKTMIMNDKIKSTNAPASFRQQIIENIGNHLPRRNDNQQDPNQQSEEVQKINLAEHYILYTRFKDEDSLKANVHKKNFLKKLEVFLDSIKKKYGTTTDTTAYANEIINALDRIPIPRTNAFKEEADDILLGMEVENWISDIPKNADKTLPLEKRRLRDAIAKKVQEIGSTLSYNDCSLSVPLKQELPKYLEKIPIKSGTNIDFLIDELANRLKNISKDIRPRSVSFQNTLDYQEFSKNMPASSSCMDTSYNIIGGNIVTADPTGWVSFKINPVDNSLEWQSLQETQAPSGLVNWSQGQQTLQPQCYGQNISGQMPAPRAFSAQNQISGPSGAYGQVYASSQGSPATVDQMPSQRQCCSNTVCLNKTHSVNQGFATQHGQIPQGSYGQMSSQPPCCGNVTCQNMPRSLAQSPPGHGQQAAFGPSYSNVGGSPHTYNQSQSFRQAPPGYGQTIQRNLDNKPMMAAHQGPAHQGSYGPGGLTQYNPAHSSQFPQGYSSPGFQGTSYGHVQSNRPVSAPSGQVSSNVHTGLLPLSQMHSQAPNATYASQSPQASYGQGFPGIQGAAGPVSPYSQDRSYSPGQASCCQRQAYEISSLPIDQRYSQGPIALQGTQRPCQPYDQGFSNVQGFSSPYGQGNSAYTGENPIYGPSEYYGEEYQSGQPSIPNVGGQNQQTKNQTALRFGPVSAANQATDSNRCAQRQMQEMAGGGMGILGTSQEPGPSTQYNEAQPIGLKFTDGEEGKQNENLVCSNDPCLGPPVEFCNPQQARQCLRKSAKRCPGYQRTDGDKKKRKRDEMEETDTSTDKDKDKCRCSRRGRRRKGRKATIADYSYPPMMRYPCYY